MKNFTLYFSTRDRYCKAVNALWNNPKYKMVCRGRYLDEKPCWYVEFKKA